MLCAWLRASVCGYARECAHTLAQDSPISIGSTHRHAHRRMHSLAGSRICTHMCTRRRIRTHARACTHAPSRLHAPTARAAVCARCGRRWTPLHRAAEKGHADVAAALLAHGADVHAKTDVGCAVPVVWFPPAPPPGRTHVGAHVWAHPSVRVGFRPQTRTPPAVGHAHARTHASACTLAGVGLHAARRAHRCARTGARTQPRRASHARRRRPRALCRTSPAHTRARTHTRSARAHGCGCVGARCADVWTGASSGACWDARACTRTHARARADSHTSGRPGNARTRPPTQPR